MRGGCRRLGLLGLLEIWQEMEPCFHVVLGRLGLLGLLDRKSVV